ncbi:MAG: NTP transferase domain-containing protein [Bacteroidota bacterium]
MKKKHQKHTQLARPNYGQFARNEWAIIGSPCGNIQQLAYDLTRALSDQYKVAYVDADHQGADEEAAVGRTTKSAMAHGATMEYTDKITFHRFDQKATLGLHQYRVHFNDQDIVLVNGNHFLAKQQIVVVDPRKEKSLQKKLDRLTDVQLILLEEGVAALPDFLRQHLAEEEVESIPVHSIQDRPAIIAFLRQQMAAALPPLTGLVLAGGKSQRMGRDKGQINYHGKEQRAHIFDQLNQLCDSSHMSCRPEQAAQMLMEFPVIADTFSGLGPLGAILSAFRQMPNRAWLVVACDLPLLDADTMQYLIDHRDPSKMATAFNSPVNKFPEPLIAIWEPRSYPILLQFLAQGYSCPRKVLINSDVKLIDAPHPKALMNVNSPEDYEEVMELLNED